jgi:isoquinoline 1-oxidoreductase alpha subunit
VCSSDLQRAWAEADVVQCGYCQSGQIMTAAALLERIAEPSDKDIDSALSGNVCRCGTYCRVREAVHLAANLKKKGGAP